MKSLFSGLITSETRVRILMRLFLNPLKDAYLRELASDLDVSPSLIRDELRQLDETGLLESRKQGRQIHYRANTQHVLFPELSSMVRKAMGMDKILDSIVTRLGNLNYAFVMDDYAEGKDTGLIDLVLVGDIDRDNLNDLVRKTENYIKRKIRTLVLSEDEYERLIPTLLERSKLVIWEAGQVADLVSRQVAWHG